MLVHYRHYTKEIFLIQPLQHQISKCNEKNYDKLINLNQHEADSPCHEVPIQSFKFYSKSHEFSNYHKNKHDLPTLVKFNIKLSYYAK